MYFYLKIDRESARMPTRTQVFNFYLDESLYCFCYGINIGLIKGSLAIKGQNCFAKAKKTQIFLYHRRNEW